MKIAVVSGDDIACEDPQQLCAALAAHGHETTACVRQRGGRSAPANDGYRTLSVSIGPRVATSAAEVLPYVGDWAATLERIWSTDQPDVVHAYGWLGGLAAQLAARRRRIPAVQTFLGLAATSRSPRVGDSRHDAERSRIEPLLARNATWVTGESSADVDALARLRRSRGRVSLLTCGVHVERYTPTGPALDRTSLHRVLCVAPNPLRYNGFDLAIKALPRVSRTELVLAETEATNRDHDEARARLGDLVAGSGVADRVRFAGPVAPDELPMLMRSADVIACTPRQPPRATTVLQAMATGKVIVAVAVGVLGDAVVDNVTGLVLPAESPAKLAAVLRSLLAQSFQCESMGAAGRSRALSRFSWDRIALDSLNVYRQLASQSRTSRDLQASAARR